MKKYLQKWRSGLVLVLLGSSLAMTLTGLMAKVSSAIRERSHTSSSQPNKAANLKIEGNYRIIAANGIPDHETGQFPNQGNPNRISSQNYSFRVPLNPTPNPRATLARGPMLFGVALNGVPFDPGTAEFWTPEGRRMGRGQNTSGWNYEALTGKIDLGLDQNNAHVQPGGAYHYHGVPQGLIQNLGNGEKMQLLGYAADGFPIYAAYGYKNATDPGSGTRKMRSSYRLKSGTRSGGPGGTYDGTFTQDYEYVAGLGDLDECNGRMGVTPEYRNGIYHYYITEEFPFVARCFRGTPDNSFRKEPPRGPGNGQQRRDREASPRENRPFPPPRRRPPQQ
ncbi:MULTISPECIES: YHYH protein [Spirulina sp. CCY15215]|uniref:YHYH protein n=1 Tax=Spirulina sp. CCY15215 TaxID=2767591 RepID=UPI00194FD256|nr:YHYH protein [Spirulina major]